MQIIFQDPLDALNPRHRMGKIVGEAPRFHQVVPKAELDQHIDTVLRQSGVDPRMKDRFAHQFSGGQRQRIGIALAVRPEIIVCVEAVASLDVSIQAQIINLFMRLREELGLSYLFVSHDIAVVRHISDRIVVMYLGRVVEEARATTLFAAPNHPYTQALLREVPRLDNRHARFNPVVGEIPSPLDPPPAAIFTRAAPMPSSAVGSNGRLYAKSRRATARPVISTIRPEDACFSPCPVLAEDAHRGYRLHPIGANGTAIDDGKLLLFMVV